MKLTASPAVDLAAVYGDSDRKLRNIVELTPTPLCIFKGTDMVLEMANQAALDVWQMGWDVIGKRLVDIVPEMAAQPFLKLMQRVYFNGVTEKGIEQPAYFIRNDGTVDHAFFNFLYQPYRENDGRITGVVVMATDVTEHVRLRKIIEADEHRYRALVKASSNMVWNADANGLAGRYAEWWESVTGKSVNTVDAFGWLEHVHPDDQESAKAAWETSLTALKEYDIEYRVRAKNGDYVHVAVKGVPLKNDDGSLREWIGTITDVTKRKQAEEALRRSEESLQRAVDSANMGVWNLDLRTGVSEFSTRAKEIFGFSASDTVNRNDVLACIVEEDRDAADDAFKRAFAPGNNGAYEAEYHIVHRKDGHRRAVRSQGTVTYDASGNPARMFGTTMDVTREKMANEEMKRLVRERTAALQEQTDFAHALLDSSVDAMMVYDADGRFVMLNKKAEAAYNVKREAIIGVKYDDAFKLDKHSESYLVLQRALRGEYVYVPMFRSAVNKRYYEMHLVPLKSNGKSHLVLAVMHDVNDLVEATEQTRAINKQLEEKNAALERTNNELRSFNFIASHDLQEPLRKIQIFSNRVLKETEFNGLVRDYLQRNIEAANRMQQLINALLGFSEITANRGYEAVPLDVVTRDAWEDLKREHESENAFIEITALPTLNGNRMQLQTLLKQLLDNALKYRKPDVPLRVAVRAQRVAGNTLTEKGLHPDLTYWRIEVEDNGIGFDQQYESKIFELFQRLHRRNEFSGTGIGLTLCRKIVDNHNGVITAESRSGIGTCVAVYLPVD